MTNDLNALDPVIWPETAARDSNGVLTIAGQPVTELVKKYGSPLFVFDREHIKRNAREYVRAFNTDDITTQVYYAGKALLTTAIASWVHAEGLGIDVCSEGELEVALRAGVDASHIIFHGNNKSVRELERAVQVGVGRIVADSLIEIERLSAIAAREGVVAQLYIRLTVGVEAHTHEFMATAHEDQKFGLSVASGAAMAAVDAIVASESLNLAGLHSHIGSQIFDASGFEVATHRVLDFAAAVRDRHGISVAELDVGGGMGIAYVEDDDPLDIAHMGKAVLDIVRTECARVNLPIPRLAVEPGRAIIGTPGITVYEVGTVKAVELDGADQRHYVSVDGGMSDNIRTALYDAQYTVVPASRVATGVAAATRVVGKHCETGDIVVRDTQLPSDIRAGDLLAVAATGAYCRSMASNYNHVPRPAVIAIGDGEVTVLLRREKLDDLLALDPGAQL